MVTLALEQGGIQVSIDGQVVGMGELGETAAR
jgi:hypothetical protein